MDQLAVTFKALSDETRLQIMTLLLAREELCVCDFVEALGLTQSKASRHLRYLYHAGLVQDRRDGLWMHYRISRDLTEQQKTIVEALSRAVSAEEKRELTRRLDD
jgi:ArsR family transcriptional regulator